MVALCEDVAGGLLSQTSKAILILYSMIANRFRHKGPRLVARPLLMAAFYKFIGRCFRFDFSLSSQVRRKEARLCKIRRCRDLKERQTEGAPTRLAALSGKYR